MAYATGRAELAFIFSLQADLRWSQSFDDVSLSREFAAAANDISDNRRAGRSKYAAVSTTGVD